MNIDQNRHENAMNVYIKKPPTKPFVIVAKENFDMNDAFTIAVERLTKR